MVGRFAGLAVFQLLQQLLTQLPLLNRFVGERISVLNHIADGRPERWLAGWAG
jgi:hypothetical protein